MGRQRHLEVRQVQAAEKSVQEGVPDELARCRIRRWGGIAKPLIITLHKLRHVAQNLQRIRRRRVRKRLRRRDRKSGGGVGRPVQRVELHELRRTSEPKRRLRELRELQRLRRLQRLRWLRWLQLRVRRLRELRELRELRRRQQRLRRLQLALGPPPFTVRQTRRWQRKLRRRRRKQRILPRRRGKPGGKRGRPSPRAEPHEPVPKRRQQRWRLRRRLRRQRRRNGAGPFRATACTRERVCIVGAAHAERDRGRGGGGRAHGVQRERPRRHRGQRRLRRGQPINGDGAQGAADTIGTELSADSQLRATARPGAGDGQRLDAAAVALQRPFAGRTFGVHVSAQRVHSAHAGAAAARKMAALTWMDAGPVQTQPGRNLVLAPEWTTRSAAKRCAPPGGGRGGRRGRAAHRDK